jgi:hypothetical protein
LHSALSALREFLATKQILRAKAERIQEKTQKKLKLRYMCTWIRIQNIEKYSQRALKSKFLRVLKSNVMYIHIYREITAVS